MSSLYIINNAKVYQIYLIKIKITINKIMFYILPNIIFTIL